MSPISIKRVLVFEFICGGGCYVFPGYGEPTGSLLHEGRMMLAAVLEEIGKIEHVEILLPIDSRIEAQIKEQDNIKGQKNIEMRPLDSGEKLYSLLQQAGSDCDQILIIAPEIDNALGHFINQLESFSSKLICPGLPVISIGSDKWKTFQLFKAHNIPTPPTALLDNFEKKWFRNQIITKPRFGAGSLQVQKMESVQELETGPHLHGKKFLIQAFAEGIPASIALGKTAKKDIIFPAMKQCFKQHTFEFQACEGPLEKNLQARSEYLLNRVASSLPEFRGYIGIDIVLGNARDGTQDVVIEINPRMTTSFCFSRHFVNQHLFEELLA